MVGRTSNKIRLIHAMSNQTIRSLSFRTPNPTDRHKQGTKYHIASTGGSMSVVYAATAANMNDTLVFEQPFLAISRVMARIHTENSQSALDNLVRSSTTGRSMIMMGPSTIRFRSSIVSPAFLICWKNDRIASLSISVMGGTARVVT